MSDSSKGWSMEVDLIIVQFGNCVIGSNLEYLGNSQITKLPNYPITLNRLPVAQRFAWDWKPAWPRDERRSHLFVSTPGSRRCGCAGSSSAGEWPAEDAPEANGCSMPRRATGPSSRHDRACTFRPRC